MVLFVADSSNVLSNQPSDLRRLAEPPPSGHHQHLPQGRAPRRRDVARDRSAPQRTVSVAVVVSGLGLGRVRRGRGNDSAQVVDGSRGVDWLGQESRPCARTVARWCNPSR
jgi:hypothetical protein